MNFQSILLTGIAVAAFAWALAVDAHAQTTAAPTSAQENAAPGPAQPGDANMAAPKHGKHHAHRMPANDSTPREKAATARLNEQQLQGTSSASNRTAPADPNMPAGAPADGSANGSAMPPPATSTQPTPDTTETPPNPPSASSPAQ